MDTGKGQVFQHLVHDPSIAELVSGSDTGDGQPTLRVWEVGLRPIRDGS